jgi:hypothetical protein
MTCSSPHAMQGVMQANIKMMMMIFKRVLFSIADRHIISFRGVDIAA